MKTITNKFKIALVAVGMLAVGTINAQTDPTDATATGTINPALSTNGGDGTSVRVVDNKGTIKYLQTNNGITSITSTLAGNTTTTTWQLGGTLTDNTYIDVSGRVFALDGIKLIDPAGGTAGDAASSNAASLSIGSDGSATGTGWTVLIRDEATGETNKILASDLISTGQAEVTGADGQTVLTGITGLAVGTPLSKISVYRNGAKLRAGVDYTAITTADNITLVPGTVAPQDWSVLAGDIIEVHWIN